MASSTTDRMQPTTKLRKEKENNLTPSRTVHGMNNHGSYAPSSAMDRMWHHPINNRIVATSYITDDINVVDNAIDKCSL